MTGRGHTVMAGEEDREAKENAGAPEEQAPVYASELDEEEEEGGQAGKGAAPLGTSPLRKADTLNRSIARFIDILIALLLSRLPGYIGLLSGLTYIGIADGLLGGRSLGKRVIGLRALYRSDLRPADFRASILRNSTISVLYLVFHIPYVGWALAVLGLGFELLLITGSPEGLRLGDEIAGTVVVNETK